MAQLERDAVFAALKRTQMFAGVTYTCFILFGSAAIVGGIRSAAQGF